MQYPIGELVNEPRALGDADEFLCGRESPVGPAPAQQGLDVTRLEGVQCDERLVHQLQLAPLHRAA